MRIVFELSMIDYIHLFLILAEVVGIGFMVYQLIDILQDKPDSGISKNSAKTKGGFFKNWLHKNSLTK